MQKMIDFMPLFIAGLKKMWWIWLAIGFGLIGTSIAEKEGEHD